MITTSIALILMALFGGALAVLGGYVYHKYQTDEEFRNTKLGKIPMLGATYMLSFGGILLILGVSFLYGLWTGEIPLTQQ